MHTTLEFTVHAYQRSQERAVPASVVRELQTAAARFVGHKVKGQRMEYRVVRHGRAFWIAAVTPGGVATVYGRDEDDVRVWALNYLMNPEQSYNRLRRLGEHRTPDERVTDELARLWLSSDQSREGSARLKGVVRA